MLALTCLTPGGSKRSGGYAEAFDPVNPAAIAAAAQEVAAGQHRDQFVIDLMEGSGGTSINMNANEVLANRALQILGDQPGQYRRVHPNDHVNLGQSTNDVVPSAVKLAVHDQTQALLEALAHLAAALEDRAAAFDDVLRIGRTCMQAGQPMRLGQAFGGYAAAVRRQAAKLAETRRELLTLPLGGTAIGTGLGAAPGYRPSLYRHLAAIVGAEVRPAANLFDGMQNADGLLIHFGGLPGTALENICGSVQQGFFPLMDHRRVHAIVGREFRHRALALDGLQRDAGLEACIMVPAFAHVLISSSLETS